MKSVYAAEKNASTGTYNLNISEDDQSYAKASVTRECEVQNRTQVKVLGQFRIPVQTRCYLTSRTKSSTPNHCPQPNGSIEVVGENLRPLACFVSIHHPVEDVFPTTVP